MADHSIRLAARADLVLFTADLLRAPIHPDEAARHAYRNDEERRPDWTQLSVDQWDSLLAAAELPEPQNELGLSLTRALSEVMEQAQAVPVADWNGEYWRLFDSSLACPINQAGYVRRDKGAILGDLAGFYRAFGWQPKPGTGERPDHLVTELEFVSLLLAMAAADILPEQQEIAIEALAKFNNDHLADWLPSFCNRLHESSCLAYFGAVSQWLALFWESLSLGQQWPTDHVSLPLDPVAESENPYECAAQGLVQLGSH